MILKEWKERRYRAYLEDIEIARKEIADVKLFPEENIICDLYALPSHNFQAYYAMIYENNRHLEMVYARTELYASSHKEPIRMYSFSENKKAEKHPGLDGRIITGIKHIPAEIESLFGDIVGNLPEGHHILGEDKVVIADGVFQAVRVFDGDRVTKETVYENAEWVPLKDHGEYLRKELDCLYITIGDLISG